MVFGLISNQTDSIITILDEGYLSGIYFDVFREDSGEAVILSDNAEICQSKNNVFTFFDCWT